MKIYKVIREECTCFMACNSYKIQMLKKCFGGIQKYTYCKKYFMDHINEMPPHGGKGSHLPCHITLPTICKKHMQTKICKDMNIKTDIALSSCRCV